MIEPWFTMPEYRGINPRMDTFEGDGIKVVRLSYTSLKEDLSCVHEYFLVGVDGKGVKHHQDYHVLGVFETDRVLEILKKNNLEARYLKRGLKTGRGVYVGVKDS